VKLEMLGFFDGTHDLDHPSAACWAALEEAGIECVRVR
jgi:hypothetical protein